MSTHAAFLPVFFVFILFFEMKPACFDFNNNKLIGRELTLLFLEVCLVLLSVTHHVVFLQTRRIQILFIASNFHRSWVAWYDLPIKNTLELVPIILYCRLRNVIGTPIEEGSSNDTYLFIMNLQVLLQIGTWGELLVADLANVRFLSSVDTLMSDEVRYLYWDDASYSRTQSPHHRYLWGRWVAKISYLRESLIAPRVLAAIRFLFVVDSGVLLQWWVLCESLITEITIKVSVNALSKRYSSILRIIRCQKRNDLKLWGIKSWLLGFQFWIQII